VGAVLAALWEEFDDAVAFIQMLLECAHLWGVKWTNTLTKMLSVLERLSAPGISPFEWKKMVRWTSGDATLERIAFIDWKGKRFFSFRVDAFFGALGLTVGSGDTKLIIAVAEFLVVIVGLILGGEKWRGETVFYVGDNENVQQWLQQRKAGSQYARHLLRVLRHLEMTFGFSLVGFYARSKHNETADLLTRAEEVERNISAAKHGLKQYPMGEALRLFTDYVEKGWTRRAFVFRGQDPEE